MNADLDYAYGLHLGVISKALDEAQHYIERAVCSGATLNTDASTAAAAVIYNALAEFRCAHGAKWDEAEWTEAATGAVELVRDPCHVAGIIGEYLTWPVDETDSSGNSH